MRSSPREGTDEHAAQYPVPCQNSFIASDLGLVLKEAGVRTGRRSSSPIENESRRRVGKGIKLGRACTLPPGAASGQMAVAMGLAANADSR